MHVSGVFKLSIYLEITEKFYLDVSRELQKINLAFRRERNHGTVIYYEYLIIHPAKGIYSHLYFQ